MHWPHRGHPSGSAYRMIGCRSLHEREPPSLALMNMAFGRPAPHVEWTGNGVRSDARGRLHFVRHAIERLELHLPPDEMATIEAAKLLVVELLRSQSDEDVRRWIGQGALDRVDPQTIATLAATAPSLAPGAQVVVSYEPIKDRTRVVWPDLPPTDVYDRSFMRWLWRCYLDDPNQAELKKQLTRWA